MSSLFSDYIFFSCTVSHVQFKEIFSILELVYTNPFLSILYFTFNHLNFQFYFNFSSHFLFVVTTNNSQFEFNIIEHWIEFILFTNSTSGDAIDGLCRSVNELIQQIVEYKAVSVHIYASYKRKRWNVSELQEDWWKCQKFAAAMLLFPHRFICLKKNITIGLINEQFNHQWHIHNLNG